MLVIDENKLKLLKMKEKLLEVSYGNQDEVLSQYKEIVLDIDRNMYDKLINMIKDTNYHNQPLEEQLEFLTTLEDEYNSFYEFQCRYRDIYEKYASDKLELSSIDDIYIDKIKTIIDAINGYLVNNQNLLRYRKNIEELNVALIEAEKKKKAIEERFDSLEKELKSSILSAEGRMDNHGNLEYASVEKEFEKYGLNLEKLLNDGELLKEELNKTISLLSSEEDKLDAAKVCFNNMPNIETKKLYNVSYFDVLNANYKLVLLNFALVLSKECDEYEDVKDKRIRLKTLIRERKKILTDLGIKYVVDPFDRIKIDGQLELVELLGKNLQNVLLVKEKIKYNFGLVDELNNKNNELYKIITDNSELFNNRNLVIGNSIGVDSQLEHEEVDKCKVINLRDISRKLNLNLIHEKTSGVINRVYELFNSVPVVSKSEAVVPELVIEKDSIFNDETNKQEVFEDNDTNQLFNDVVAENEDIFAKNDNIFKNEASTQGIFADDNTKKAVNDELFTEVEPFQETVLFTNKYDDVFASSNDKKVDQKEIEMPELFFGSEQKVFDDNDEDEQVKELSLDEQIKALKLVA